MSFLRQLAFSATLIASCQCSLVAKTIPDHFDRDASHVRELSCDNTLGKMKLKQPVLYNRLVIFLQQRYEHPVSVRDKDIFEDLSKQEIAKDIDDIRVQQVKVNSSGTLQYLLQGSSLGLCGATGNCQLMLLEIMPENIKIILDTYNSADPGGYEFIKLRHSFTNGYRDIILAAHVSSSDRELDLFRFIKGKYHRTACYYSTYTGDDGRVLDRPNIFRIKEHCIE